MYGCINTSVILQNLKDELIVNAALLLTFCICDVCVGFLGKCVINLVFPRKKENSNMQSTDDGEFYPGNSLESNI